MKIKQMALVLAVSSSLLFGSLAFAAVKAGSACSKVGSTSTVSGKKYTCIKSGKKLVWDKGVTVKKPTLVAPELPKVDITPIPAIDKQIDLTEDKRITSDSGLSDRKLCKTIDLTQRGSVNNGFPRSSDSLYAPTKAKILVLPVNLKYVPYTDQDLEKIRKTTDEVIAFYKKISFGKFELEFSYPDKSEWVTLDKTTQDLGINENKPQQNNEIVVTEAFKASSPTINFDIYDAVMVETGFFNYSGGGQGFSNTKYPTSHGYAKGVSLEFGYNAGQFTTIAHELGHTLFYLEDLYVFLKGNEPALTDRLPAGPWDMMSNSTTEFFGWSKLLMGLLPDAEFRCITNQKDSTHYISNIDSVDGNKLVLINLGIGHTLAMESRLSSTGNQGLLVYEIDTAIDHGDGPIKAQKILIDKGGSIALLGWKINVIDTAANGLLVNLSKAS